MNDGVSVSALISGELRWDLIGQVTAQDGVIQWPQADTGCRVYRWLFRDSSGESAYVGECEDFKRRMGGYQRPGPTQPTNQSVNARIRDTLARGSQVYLEGLAPDGLQGSAPLNGPFYRKAVENLAVLASRLEGKVILNK